MTQEQLDALAALIRYNWKDELRDYEEHQKDGDMHIFHKLVILDNFLGPYNDRTADFYLRKDSNND